MKYFIAMTTCTLVLLAAAPSPDTSQPDAAGPVEKGIKVSRGFDVQWEGKMMQVHREGDASPRVELAPLAEKEGTFAIGPLAGLRGEITAIDGKIYISRVEEGRPAVDHGWGVQAPFLVFGHVGAWLEVSLPATVTNLEELEVYLPHAAEEAGIDPDAPFPFKLLLPQGEITYHIIHNTEDGYAVTRPHQELMERFEIAERGVTLIGVHSTQHAGVFTHHGQSTHIHVVSDDGQDAGHLEDATFGDGAKLYVPRP